MIHFLNPNLLAATSSTQSRSFKGGFGESLASPDEMEFKRYLSLDYFRGFSVFLMILFNLVPLYSEEVPLILQHGREDMFLFGDLAAPFFLYIMGVALAISVRRRRAKGQTEREVFDHVLKRTLYLFAIGLILDATIFKTIFTWGVLETLAVSYLISYLLLECSISLKILAVLAMYLVYGYLSSIEGVLHFIRAVPHGSPLSSLSWAPITIIGTMCGERLAMRNKRDLMRFLFHVGVLLTALGYVLSFKIPLNKRIVSVSYSMLSTGASAIFFLIFYHLVEVRSSKHWTLLLSPLKVFGVNALLVWILQYLLGYYPVYYGVGHARFLPLAQGSVLTIGVMATIWAVGRILLDKGVVIKL